MPRPRSGRLASGKAGGEHEGWGTRWDRRGRSRPTPQDQHPSDPDDPTPYPSHRHLSRRQAGAPPAPETPGETVGEVAGVRVPLGVKGEAGGEDRRGWQAPQSPRTAIPRIQTAFFILLVTASPPSLFLPSGGRSYVFRLPA